MPPTTFNGDFWKLITRGRGVTTMSEALDAVTLLALLKQQRPTELRTINNMGAAAQEKAIHALIDQLSEAIPGCIADFPPGITNEFLTDALQLVASCSDLSELIECVRDSFNQTRENVGSQSGANELKLFMALTNDYPGGRLFDGAAGLANIPAHLDAHHFSLQELNHQNWKMGYRLLLLSGCHFDYTEGDSLISPSVEAESCDLAVITPPLGIRFSATDRNALEHAPYLLNGVDKTIPASAGDSLWVQLALYSLKKDGKAWLLLPPGWFFRGGYDAKVREYLLEHELVEAVIALPGNFLDNTAINTVVLALDKAKEKGSAVHFVDARDIGQKDGRKIQITSEDASYVSELAKGKHPEDPRFRAVYMPEIRRQGGNELLVQRYIVAENALELPDVSVEMKKLARAQQHYDQAQAKLTQLLAHYQKH